MKVVHISSMDGSGAGKAAYRLHKGLQALGVDSHMRVMCKGTTDSSVEELPSVVSSRPKDWWRFLTSGWNARMAGYPLRSPDNELFSDFSSAVQWDLVGPGLLDADIINLHWVAGLFDASIMPSVLKGKKIIWTLHDMNPMTGGCHYAEDCVQYRKACGACPQLASNREPDLSRAGWLCKSEAYRHLDITVVTPSRWLGGCSSGSGLLGRFRNEVIPYGFPLDIFKPVDRQRVRAALNIPPEAKVVLFCASSVTLKRKGFRYLLESLGLLSQSGRGANIVLAVIGSCTPKELPPDGYPVMHFGSIADETHMALLYNAADVFVLPSLQDNLPNTVVESLACGTPVAAFAIGGVPDMVEQGRTGCLAPGKDIQGLAEAIDWCLHCSPKDIRQSCRSKAEKFFSLETQARSYFELYNSLCLTGAHASLRPQVKKVQAKISIVTPSYNQADYLAECIDSILSQNYPNLEYIIMDGGSTDGSVEIIKKHEKHLAFWQSKPDGGHYQAINEGFLHSTGEIMAWLNSDDKYHPGAFWLVSDSFRILPKIEWVMGSPTGWDENGKASYFSSQPPLWSREKYLRGEIGPPHIQQESTFWRRTLWLKAGGSLDTNFAFAADAELWARFFRYTQLHTLHAPIGGFRRQPNQKTAHFIDRYDHEADQIVERERKLVRSSGVTSLLPAPPPLYIKDVVSQARSSITPSNFGFFTYSRIIHFPFFGNNDVELYKSTIDPDSCDLKAYQDLLVYTFIKQNIPAGSRILEIGGGNSRIIRALRNDYECWNLDKLEGVGDGPIEINAEGFTLVRDYIGSFSPELPNGYFDFAFSISALEHVEETEENYRSICDDIARILKPDGWSLHCFDIVAKIRSTWTNGLLPYIFKHIRTANKFAPFEQICLDPFAYAMSEKSYNRYWRAVTKISYREHGFPISYNVLWSNRDSGTLTVPVTLSVAKENGYLVSAIVSTYNSERYFRACIENLIGQTLYRKGQLEIIIINSGSQQGEESIAKHFLAKHSHIVYQRTERETLYASWNRAIGISKGRYIVNTNTDDSLRDDALELLAVSLNAHPSADLAYADCALTRVPNDRFDASHAYRISDYPPYSPALGMLCCLLGPHPMWRRTVFNKIGFFDVAFHAAGDYDFQMRFIKAGCSAVHVPEVLSQFFQNANGLTLASERSHREAQHIEKRYRACMPIERLYAADLTDPQSAAVAWVAQGNLALSWQCPWLDRAPPLFEYAAACYQSALVLNPSHPQALRNLCAIIARHGQWDQCRDLLAKHACHDEDLKSRVNGKRVPSLAPVHVLPAIEPMIHTPENRPKKSGANPESLSLPTRPRSTPPRPLHVLYDISVLGLGMLYESARTGIFRVVENVVLGLASSPEIELAFCATQSKTERSPETIKGCRKYLAAHAELRHIPFFDSALPPADLFHSPFHAIPKDVHAPVRFLTVYDLIPILFPQYMPPHVTALQKITLSMLKPDDRFLCISQTTRSDLCRVSGIAPERTQVTYLAADRQVFHPCSDERQLSAVREKYRIGKDHYILSLCTLEPRKNIDHVIRAFDCLVRQGTAGRTKLVLVGTHGWDFERVYREINRNPELQRRIVKTGYVADEDLAALYSEALSFVYMSLYEGFGLPPLEAMQCGTPVIVSNLSSLPEVVGDAGIMLDPNDLNGLCLAMNEVIVNRELREEMSRRALLQASQFSWKRCVEETITAYRSAVNPSGNAGHAENLSAA
jgi:glycosyltransferase involved in cell wall biosynthesis